MVGIMVLGVLRSPNVDDVGVVIMFIGLRRDDRGVVDTPPLDKGVTPVDAAVAFAVADVADPGDPPPLAVALDDPVAVMVDPSSARRLRLL